MRYKSVITQTEKFDISQTILKLDEFLKEYWGEEVYYIAIDKNRILRNTDLFDFNIKTESIFSFCGFRERNDYQYLQEHKYNMAPARAEIFSFTITVSYIEVCLYNSFETNERERQFDKIVENIKVALNTDLALIRTRIVHEHLTDVMCKYRRNEGKIGFSIIPSINERNFKACDSIFIFWSDFAYLRPFIYQVYPLRWNGEEDSFEDTSWNDIHKSEWIRILDSLKNYKTNDIKLSAFYNFFIKWLEEQLTWANYICIWGNL